MPPGSAPASHAMSGCRLGRAPGAQGKMTNTVIRAGKAPVSTCLPGLAPLAVPPPARRSRAPPGGTMPLRGRGIPLATPYDRTANTETR
ncbi:hypothetical protein BGLA2_2800008 [Burkholderia gladioli]|nr:hypothetical protein BGLA2_2800008 [Burkholderia gladioli]